MRYPTYEEYKDCGVVWFGEVPKHWEIKRLKHVKSQQTNGFVDGPFGSNLKSQHFIEGGDVYVIESNFATQGILDTTKLKTISLEHFLTISRSEAVGGDIIIAKIGAQFGKSSILPELDKPAVVSGNSLKLTINPKIVDTKFVDFVLGHLKKEGAIDDIVNTTAQPALSLGGMNNLPFPLPSLEEQIQIVTFLDRETVKIDTLIVKQEELIRLLGEKRTAVISHAVTKGLNPHAPLKDSGIEWLGQIPAHWMVKTLKQTAVVQSGIAKGRKYDDSIEVVEVPYLRVANVQDGYLNLNDVAEIEIAKHEVNRYLLQDGDVLMNEGGDNDKLGRGAVWRSQVTPCIHQNHVFAVRVHGIEPEWLDFYTRGNAAKFYFYSVAKQSTNLASISSSSIKDLKVLIPPKKERLEIMDQLNIRLGKLDLLLAKSQSSIDLLKERRTALISAAVTGKIDVRHAIPQGTPS